MYANLRPIFVQLQIYTFIHSGIFSACTTSFAIHSQNNICWQIQMYWLHGMYFPKSVSQSHLYPDDWFLDA